MTYPTSIPEYNKFRAKIDANDIDVNDRRVVAIDAPVVLMRYIIGNAWLTSDVNAISGDRANRQAVVDLMNNEVFMADFCEAMVDCIQNNEAVKDALSELLGGGGEPFAPAGTDTVIGSDNSNFDDTNLVDSVACNDDAIAGACYSMVDFMDTHARDWIEGMSGLALYGELPLYILQSLPILNSTGIDAGDLIDWITDEVLTQYNASVDTALKYEAACTLYSLACIDCELSLTDVIGAFLGEISVGFSPVKTWAQLITDIVTLSVGDQIVYAVWGLMCATWKAQSVFQGISGVQALKWATANSTPIDPVTMGCDPCATSCELPITVNPDSTSTPDCVTLVDITTIGALAASPSGYAFIGSSAASTRWAEFDVTFDAPITGTISVTAVFGAQYNGSSSLQLGDVSGGVFTTRDSEVVTTPPTGIERTLSFSATNVSQIRLRCGRTAGGLQAMYIWNARFS